MSNKQEGPDGHVSASANINSETPNSNSTPTFIKEGISNVDIQNKLGKIEDDYATRQPGCGARGSEELQGKVRESEELHGVADQSGVNGPKLAEVNTTSQVRKKSKKKKVIRI
ncbi:hypothetical protein ACO0QE_001098 [Hanseniaspora vineae]